MLASMRTTSWLALLLLGGLGCGDAAKDFENICHAEERSGAASITDPARKAMTVAQWLNDHVTSGDAKAFMSAIASASSESRGELLRQAAREAGYTGDCPMADATNE